jgi:sulfide:quinone oxidoreductase
MDIEGPTNPRNPTFRNIDAGAVCIAIPPVEATPVSSGAAKTAPHDEKPVLQMVDA